MSVFFAIMLILFSLIPEKGTGQMNLPQKYFKLVAGDTLSDIIYSSVTPTVPALLGGVEGLEILPPVHVGDNRYEILVRPSSGNGSPFRGQAVIPFQYYFDNKPYFISYHLDYGASVITCNDDYKSYATAGPIILNPLLNDHTTFSGLQISGIGNVTGGAASFTESTISFIPDPTVRKGFVLYSVKDSAGTTANALIHFIREIPAGSETMEFTLLNTQKQTFYLPAAGFSIDLQPSKGSVVTKSGCGICYEYDPNTGVSGSDLIRFQDGSGNIITVNLKIINKAQNTSSVRDDVIYTLRNTPVTFNVFENDLTDEFPISSYSSRLVADPNIPGKFTFTPPNSSEKVWTESYNVNYGSFSVKGNVTIKVNNYKPQQDLVYQFRTLANTPLLLEYNVPIMGYDFELLSEPIFGDVEISGDSLFMECDTFTTEKVYIKYTPLDQPGIESDEFDIKYYLTNGDTFIYKIYVDIIPVLPGEEIDCPCITPDCVRKGDLNADGRVSVSDILPLARFMSLSGIERVDHAHSDDVGTYAQDWGMIQPSGLDIKHIDANGDGLISVEDTSSVDYNYGKLHTLVPEEVLSEKSLAFTANKQSYLPGDTLIVCYEMGSSQKPALNVFGITFSFNSSSVLLDSASVCVNYDDTSWFSYSAPSLNFWRQPQKGKLEIAHAITGGIVEDELEGFRPKGSSGFGNIGCITAIVEDELEGFKGVKNTAAPKQALHNTENRAKGLAQGDNYSDSYTTKTIRIGNIVIEDIYGERFMVPDTFIQVKIRTKGSIPQPTEAQLLVFPNPANDVVHVHFNGRNLIYDLKIFNSQGQEIQQITQVLQQHISLDTHQWAPGMYVIQVQSQQGIINKKVIIH